MKMYAAKFNHKNYQALENLKRFLSSYNSRVSHTSNATRLFSINDITQEDNIKKCINRLQDFSIPSLVKKPETMAAVLIPLCINFNEVSLLFTLRKADLKHHRRQVSFPGGRQDEHENLIETALRETEEELGINRELIKVWGHGNTVNTIQYNILPVVGYIGDISQIKIKPNPNEVESVFTVSLSHLCDTRNCKYTQFRFKSGGHYVMPTYVNIPYRIWGVTGVLTHLILLALLPNEYNLNLNIGTL